MCLVTKQEEPLIAEEDIVCYKILRWDEVSNVVVTPHCSTVIPTIPYLMDDNQTTDDIRWDSVVHFYFIGGGYIHSLLKLPSLVDFSVYNVIYVKCIIPKGTPYFVGVGGDLCSKKLQLVDFIPLEEVLSTVKNHSRYEYVKQEACTTEKVQELFPDAPSAKTNKTSCVEV